MKTILAATAMSLLVVASAAADIRGAWTAESEVSGKMQLNLTTHRSNHGETMNAADFTGLSPAALDATAQTPVSFELRREAGTIAFEGTFKNGFGAGQFTFKPNPDYDSALRTLGVTFSDGSSERQLLTMALLDVSTAFIRSLQAEGYHETAEKYVRMRIFGIDADYVRRMNALK